MALFSAVAQAMSLEEEQARSQKIEQDLSPAVEPAIYPTGAWAMGVQLAGVKASNMQRSVYHEGVHGVDEDGEKWFSVPNTRGKAIVRVVPLYQDPYEIYMTEKLERDLGSQVRVEDIKNARLVQVSQEEWQWRLAPAVEEGRAGERDAEQEGKGQN